MKDKDLRALCLGGLLCGGTLLLSLISLPLPSSGYVNLGDVGLYLGICLLPTPLGAAAVALGAVLSDLLLGWAMYIPATALIKLTAALLGIWLQKKRFWLSGLSALLLPVGYFAYEYLFLMGKAAAVNLPGTCMQALIGALLGLYLGKLLIKKKGKLWKV